MTTNIERVVRTLTGEGVSTTEAHRYAQALADDDTLMPNFPELRDMGSGIAELPRGVQVRDRRTVHVYLADDYGQGKATLASQEARAYGKELIAAANYIEQEHT